MSQPSLKRLGFILGYVNAAVSITEGVYKKARSFVPGFVEPYVGQAEDTVTSFGAPYYTWAQDLASKVLQTADQQVDSAASTLSSGLDFSRELHGKNMKAFNTAKDSYFTWLESTVDKVKSVANPWPYAQWGIDTAKTTWDKVVDYVDPDKLVDGVAKVTTYAPVAKALDLGEPVIKPIEAQYKKGHDYLVTNPTYSKLYKNVETSLTSASTSPYFQKAYSALWTVAEPVAGPLYDNFARSKYLAQLADHLKPKLA